MKIVFWGTPDFAVPSLGALLGEGHDIMGVVSQPDRPAGRGRRVRTAPVAAMAQREGLPLLQPDRPQGNAFVAALRAWDADLAVVVAYGHILSPEVLAVPARGSVNVHASLLPELRGAAPVNWAIARGYERTGVTVMRMVAAMDAGPILFQTEEPILSGETASDLSLRLSEVGAEALVEALALMEVGVLEEVEQDHDRATFAPKVGREVARIDWNRPASVVANHIRGMDQVPGAWAELHGTPVKLFRATAMARDDDGLEAQAGTILDADPTSGLVVAAGAGAVEVREVQPPGKKRMAATAWIQGRGAEAGQRFD